MQTAIFSEQPFFHFSGMLSAPPIMLSIAPSVPAVRVRNAVNVVLECFKRGDDWKTARKKLLIAEPSSFGEIGGEWKGVPSVPASEKCPVFGDYRRNIIFPILCENMAVDILTLVFDGGKPYKL